MLAWSIDFAGAVSAGPREDVRSEFAAPIGL
jgi:hypothetical protein